MGIPMFFLLLLMLVIVLIAVLFIYFQLYKRNINKVLGAGMGKQNQMAPPYKATAVAVTLVFLATTGIICYFVGYKSAYDDFEYGLSVSNAYPQTFYAEITEIKEHMVLVQGLSVNDINFRGEFAIQLYEETQLEWRYTEIEFEDLDVGDTVAITFDGEVMETYPAKIPGVLKIQLLDDEK